MQAEARENSAYYFYEAGARYAKLRPMSTFFESLSDKERDSIWNEEADSIEAEAESDEIDVPTK